MKKFIFIFALLLGAVVGFVTGDPIVGMIIAVSGAIWPFGEADVQTPAFSATIAVTVTDNCTIIVPATLTGAMTLNLTIDPKVRKGALLQCQLTSDGTARTTTFGTGFTSVALAGVISKTLVQTFMFDGTTFKPVSGGFQIN